MKVWKRIALASALGAAVALPVYAGDGDALQSRENEHGNAIERNPVMTPNSTPTTPVPYWDSRRNARAPGTDSMAYPGSNSTNDAPSAAEESRATGKVDAGQAAPPQNGSDVQAGDMGPSSPKAQ